MTVADYLTSTALWVHLATLSYILGFFTTRQVMLRLLILSGTICYIVYYYAHLGQPQWDAIIGSGLILAANLVGLARLLWYRLPLGMTDDDQEAFMAMGGGLLPGEFRRLMRFADRRSSTGPVSLTREGIAPGILYFVVRGEPILNKDGERFRLASHCFVGEVAFKLRSGASATVDLPEGGTWLAWEVGALHRLLDDEPRLAKAFDAVITQDMATKIAAGAPARARAIA